MANIKTLITECFEVRFSMATKANAKKEWQSAIKMLSLMPSEKMEEAAKVLFRISKTIKSEDDFRSLLCAPEIGTSAFISQKGAKKLVSILGYLGDVSREEYANAAALASTGRGKRPTLADNFLRQTCYWLINECGQKFNSAAALDQQSGYAAIGYTFLEGEKEEEFLERQAADYSPLTAGTQYCQIKNLLISLGLVEGQKAVGTGFTMPYKTFWRVRCYAVNHPAEFKPLSRGIYG